jgi:mono/diheme cytochrome c family protein
MVPLAGFAGRGLLALLAATVLGCGGVDGDTAAVEGSDSPGPDAGRRIYRDGILPSGEPLTALVAGDVPILGTQFSCQSCHGRSGMGASEGAYIVPPVAAQFLFVESPQPKRPAYNTESLARVLRDGVTSSGRLLSEELMPRYPMAAENVEALAAYLATLSPGNSPGVDDQQIRFATVITEGVDPKEREAVLAVLNKFAAEINRQTRNESERWDRGYTPESRLPTVFREWVLDEWTLSGPSDSWAGQLAEYYERAPVFAMLSGLGTGTWAPIARFCERREIPCLFPGTDLPEAETGDFYTLYFSRGLALEADLIAAHVAAQPVASIIQVYCEAASAGAAALLQKSLSKDGVRVDEVAFDCKNALPAVDLAARIAANPESAVVLWLRPEQVAAFKQALPVSRVYVSSTLLKSQLPDSFLSGVAAVFMAHPYVLPGKSDSAMQRFKLWAKTRDVELVAPRLQAEAFFACLTLNDAVKHVGRFFVRDYVLDMLDHAQGMLAYLPFHARPTIGPGQRFLTKGGYVLPIVDGHPDTRDATWIIP